MRRSMACVALQVAMPDRCAEERVGSGRKSVVVRGVQISVRIERDGQPEISRRGSRRSDMAGLAVRQVDPPLPRWVGESGQISVAALAFNLIRAIPDHRLGHSAAQCLRLVARMAVIAGGAGGAVIEYVAGLRIDIGGMIRVHRLGQRFEPGEAWIAGLVRRVADHARDRRTGESRGFEPGWRIICAGQRTMSATGALWPT